MANCTYVALSHVGAAQHLKVLLKQQMTMAHITLTINVVRMF